MTINAVEQTPDGPDIVHTADPGTDAIAEPTGPEVAGGIDSITHVPSARRPSASDHPAFAGMGVTTTHHKRNRRSVPDIDKVLTGTVNEPERAIHDEAVQVRQLLPNSWDVHAIPVVAGQVPVQLLVKRPERITYEIYNNGPATLYIAPSYPKCSLQNGRPLPSGASFTMNSFGEVFAVADAGTGASADVRVTETWRTDNGGN